MESKEKVDRILESLRAEVTAFVEQESEIKTSLEYEERVLELSRQFAKGLIGESPAGSSLPKK